MMTENNKTEQASALEIENVNPLSEHDALMGRAFKKVLLLEMQNENLIAALKKAVS